MQTVAIAVRWVHFIGASSLVGVFTFLVLVGRPAARAAGPDVFGRFASLDARLMAIGLWALGATLASGLLDLWRQVTVATGLSLRESLAVESFSAVLGQTRYGAVWLVRHALLALLGALLVFRTTEGQEGQGADWLALRLEGATLAVASLGIVGVAGHAASAQQAPAAAIVVDAVHLLATGLWLGGLIPLALFLRWALALPPGAGGTAAATATRRFSAVGLASVGLLTVTGIYNAWEQVASFPALFGTLYGRWLSLKLLLLLPLLLVAALNLLVLEPRLVRDARGDPSATDRRLIRRLRQHVLLEATLGWMVLAVVAVLGLTTPARHAEPTWPFSFRFAWEATKDFPGVRTRVAIGSQLAMLGLVATLLAVILRRRRWRWVMGAGAGAVAVGLGVSLPTLSIDAYPTTYLRPTIPYTATSVTQGRALYRAHCASCHGAGGHGDGPAAVALRPRPADLTAKHTADHTVGDLFWWLTHGIPRSAMPGFGDRLSAEERWDVVNFLRTLAASEEARVLGSVAAPEPSLVAPDFSYTVGVGEGRALKDHRQQGPVLLVLFSVPDSLERLLRLNDVYRDVRALGGEVLGIPLRPARDIYRQLAGLGEKVIFFPIVVDGAAEAAATYTLFRRDLTPEGQLPEPPIPTHMEFLIDRQGYLRARWIPGAAPGWADSARLLAEVERLAREAPRAPAPDEHVH